MVPLRKIFETLGAQIEWYGETETVVATKGDTIVKLQINNPIAERVNRFFNSFSVIYPSSTTRFFTSSS